MQRFTQLYQQLDRTTRTSEKLAALERYFREAPPPDAAWALYILGGKRLMRAIPVRLLRACIAATADVPLWLVDESYAAVGDLSETLSLLIPQPGPGTRLPLKRIIEERLLCLPGLDDAGQCAALNDCWREFSRPQAFLLHKLVSGNFRVGVASTLVIQALANVAGVSKAVMAHRLMGRGRPTADDYQRLLSGASGQAGDDTGRPYPFLLANPLLEPIDSLGEPRLWLAEWKWDGIRAQLIRRDAETVLWSRGEEIINGAFPELVQAAQRLPDGTVLDGEIVAWENERPLPFAELQRRINRQRVDLSFWPAVPVVYLAFDLLELAGRDRRAAGTLERRQLLDQVFSTDEPAAPCPPGPTASPRGPAPLIRVSPVVPFATWQELANWRHAARQRGTEGLMLKRAAAPYGVGRPRGDWWKWKVDPLTIDAVLMFAQGGSGRRASLFTDYTFGVWDGDQLVTVAKAYSGLTDAEIRAVDAFVRRNTVTRHGPVHAVKPELVFELAFASAQPSTRHRAGLALRFPRINRWRRDKRAEDADNLAALRALLRA